MQAQTQHKSRVTVARFDRMLVELLITEQATDYATLLSTDEQEAVSETIRLMSELKASVAKKLAARTTPRGKVKDVAEKPVPTDRPTGKPKGNGHPDVATMNVKDLRSYLHEQGRSFPSRATKAELVEIANAS